MSLYLIVYYISSHTLIMKLQTIHVQLYVQLFILNRFSLCVLLYTRQFNSLRKPHATTRTVRDVVCDVYYADTTLVSHDPIGSCSFDEPSGPPAINASPVARDTRSIVYNHYAHRVNVTIITATMTYLRREHRHPSRCQRFVFDVRFISSCLFVY